MLIDDLQSYEYRYEVYLCQAYSPYSIIASLSGGLYNQRIKHQLMGIDEFSGTISKYWNDTPDIENDNYDLVVAGKVLLIERYIDTTLDSSQYFKIVQCEEEVEVSICKNFTAYSLEYSMNKTKVREFTYSGVAIYDSVNPWNSATPCIVNYLFEEALLGTWDVNTISASLLGTYRTFDISEDTVYGVIKQIQDQWNCVFIFDTVSQEVDILDYASLNGKTGLILSDENYLNKITNQIKIDEIITRLYVKGTDPITVSSHSITGQSYIDDFSYFTSSTYMSAGLLSAWDTYDDVVTANTTNFTSYLSSLTTKQLALATLQDDLSTLNTDLNILKDKEDGAMKNSGTYDGHTYTYWHSLVISKEAEITSKESAITSKNNEITVVEGQLATIRSNVSYANNFTTDQLKELLSFVNEDTVSFDTDDGEELLELGTALLTVKAQPPIEFELDMIDIFSCQSESFTWDKLTIGYQIDLMSERISLQTSPRITLIEHDIDNQDLKITVSNKMYYNDDLNYVTSIFEKSKQTANLVGNERDIYKEYNSDKLNILTNTSDINAANNNIILGSGTLLSERGMYMRDADTDLGQMRILGNRILFSSDAWATYSLAITHEGICTDGTFKLYSANKVGSNNITTINGNGIAIYGSGTVGEGIIIKNLADATVFSLDTSGNIVMNGGTLTITTGLPTTQLSDGSKFLRDDISYNEVSINSTTGLQVLKKSGGATKATVTLNATTGLSMFNASSTPTFQLDTNGNIEMTGSITMTGGSISWADVGHDPTIATAQSTAENAQTAANNAQSSANTANALLADIASDNKLTPVEKIALKKEWDAILSEKTLNDTQADTFSVSKTDYGTKYNALYAYVVTDNGLLTSLTTTTDITGSTFRSKFKDYYDARTNLLNAIADKARTLANTAQSTANTAVSNAATAQSSANTANSLLSDIASDSKLTPVEKIALKKEWDAIVEEKGLNVTQASNFGVSSTSYVTKYDLLYAYVVTDNSLLTNLTTTNDITGTTFRSKFKDYYDARTNLLNAIATEAKRLAGVAQTDLEKIANGKYSGGTFFNNDIVQSGTVLTNSCGITNDDGSDRHQYVSGVINPSYANAGTDIRIWAGDTYANRASAKFRVNQNGDLVATSATISGTINASAGTFSGSITSSATITGGTIQTASSGARVVINSSGMVSYLTGTTKHGIFIDPNYSDLIVYNNGNEMFKVYNSGTGEITLQAWGNSFLNYNDGDNTTYPLGEWDFSSVGCTVSGLTVKFA
jgi:hypothetical protein